MILNRFPLRWTLPALFLFLGMLALWVIYYGELRSSYRRVEKFESAQIRVLGSIAASEIEASLTRDDPASAQRYLEHIRGDRDLARAALIRSDGEILISTHYIDRGERLGETPFAFAADLMAQTLANHRAEIRYDEHSNRIVGMFPVVLSSLPGRLPPSASSVLVTIHDLESPLSFARADAQGRLIKAAVVLGVFCIILWLLLRGILLSRIQALVAATGRIAEGDYRSPVVLSGNDELTELSESLVRMETQLEAHDEELRRNERYYRSIIESIDDIVSIIGPDFRFVYVSPSTERVSGYPPEWFIGKDAFISVPQEDAENNRTLMEQVLRGEVGQCELESKFEQADGSIGFYHTVCRRLESEEAEPCLLLSSRNVTALKRIEHALRESESRFNSLFDSLHDGAWAIPADGTGFMYANQALERIYGRKMTDFRKNPELWIECTHPDDREIALNSLKQLNEEGAADVEYRIIRPDGTVRWIHERKQLIYDDKGRPARKGGLISDVTEAHEAAETRNQLEAQLRQTQKMEAIGTLAGGVAHDFNNLLTAINGYSDLLVDAMGDDHEFIHEVREIRSAGDRAAALTRQLLMFSRQEMSEARLIDLNATVRDLNRMLTRLIGEHIGYTSALSPVPLRIWADPGQVEQIVINLVVNARDAMEEGGTLNIRTERTHFSEGERLGDDAARPGAYARLVVQDTGTGMSEEVLSRIFEPFYTTKAVGKGTGLGLATIFGIVKQCLGYIQVKSREGEGATFEVYFPLARARDDASEPDEPNSPKLRGTECILFVEDERIVREIGARILREQGYRVIEAEDGIEALEIAHAPGLAIHLIVTDVVMPGMTGRDLAARLIELHPNIKVLFVSGYGENSLGNSAMDSGNVSFLQKPYDPVSLAGKVREVLDGTGERTVSEA